MAPNLQPNTLPPPPPLSPISSVLVVGGCGFLGHHIVHQLLLRHPKAQIHVLDLRCTANRFDSPNVSYHDGDISKHDTMATLLDLLHPQVVIHTASPHFGADHRRRSRQKADDLMYRVNVEGTKILLAESERVGTTAFVYTSSASVVQKRSLVHDGGIVNADEDRWETAPQADQCDWYMTTKGLAEGCVLRANRPPARAAAAAPGGGSPPFLTAAIRPACIYGEGDVQMMPAIMQAARRGQWRFQLGDNANLFDTTYAANAAIAHLLAAEALLYTAAMSSTLPIDGVERVDGEAFFITNDAPVPFWDFCRAVWVAAGVQLDLRKVWTLSEGQAYWVGTLLEALLALMGRRPSLTREKAMFSCVRRYYRIDKAKIRLGYSPVVSFEESIRRTVRDIDDRGVGGLSKPEGSAVLEKVK